ncbi:MAG: ribosome biogenesis GTPase Der [Omnitrophica WOR_2 bacterium RIFCSPHIGHO2_02_FULL_67_20]|nr:MAG: ribosome biogenesis GTPase Der [Omnitrophica WOR_2 bacterium RIFCSPHIGHO2_02_FULL_67_20]
MSTNRPPLIAIVGRPNVGKSTLFNRLLGERRAVVSTTRGTTRDRIEGRVEWRGRVLRLLDTGGLEFSRTEGLPASVQRQIRRALEEAEGFLFVCDARDGLLPADAMVMDVLRGTGKPVLLAVNKADERPVVPPDFFSLGAPHTAAVSALHGTGTGDLLDVLVDRFSPPSAGGGPAPELALAIVGRQNVGKSSLFNALLRDERAIVSDAPGTTRDAVESSLQFQGAAIALIDTAGLRHRRKVTDPIDTFSMSRAMEAIQRCDVALVVLDATQGITSDDRRLLCRLCGTGCGIVVLLNKWDLMQAPGAPGGRRRLSEEALAKSIRDLLPDASAAPVLPVSAKTGFQVMRAVAEAMRVARALRDGLSDGACEALMRQAWAAHAPPRLRGRAIRLERARWVPGRPARVELATRPIGALPRPYRHYLLKRLHASPALVGVPVRLVVMDVSHQERASRQRRRAAWRRG